LHISNGSLRAHNSCRALASKSTESLSGTPWDKPLSAVWVKIPATGAENFYQWHLPVTVPNREQEVIEKAQEFAKGGPLPAAAIGRIYQKLVEEMRNWEATLDAAAPQSSSKAAAKGGSK
jgi:chorismate mutase